MLKVWPEGLGPYAEKEYKALAEFSQSPGVIVRPEALELIHTLQKGREAGFVNGSIPSFTILGLLFYLKITYFLLIVV